MKRRDTRIKQIYNSCAITRRVWVSKVETFSLLKSHHLARGIRVIPAIYTFLERDITRNSVELNLYNLAILRIS